MRDDHDGVRMVRLRDNPVHSLPDPAAERVLVDEVGQQPARIRSNASGIRSRASWIGM